jgi:hypothetical protein
MFVVSPAAFVKNTIENKKYIRQNVKLTLHNVRINMHESGE